MKKTLFKTVVAGTTILLSLTGCRPETIDEKPFHPKEDPPVEMSDAELLWDLQQIHQ